MVIAFPAASSQAKKYPATKGTIVCDASALRTLIAPLPPEYLTEAGLQKKPSPTLADTLFFLARHGYEVIIPEMVANEMGGFMRDGKNYYLTYYDTIPHEVNKRRAFQPFFQKVVELEASGVPIHIQPPLPENRSIEAAYVNQIYEIHRSELRLFEKIEALKKAEQGNIERRHQHDAGDHEIIAYIHATHMANSPIFLLSNDGQLQQSFTDQPNIHAIGAAGFLTALQNAAQLSSSGIGTISLPQYSDVLRNRYPPRSKKAAAAAAKEAEIFLGWNSRNDTHGGAQNPTASPFAEAMMTLAAELKEKTSVSELIFSTPATVVHHPVLQHGIHIPAGSSLGFFKR